MKIIVTGAAGMLGQDMLDELPEDEVLPVDIQGDAIHLDITDLEAVQSFMKKNKPDIVLHLAAYTNVDGCQTDPDTAWKVNAGGTWNLASACAEQGSGLLYISSDFVFSGNGTHPYDEFDAVGPLSVYGKTKLAGERFTRSLVSRHYVVRTAWLYGARGKSFPGTMIRMASEGKPLRVVGDQVGSPTYTRDLARYVSKIIRKPLYGVYHVTNSGQCSWYEFARSAVAMYGMPEAQISRITSDEWPTPTKRPAYSVLAHQGLYLAGLEEPRHWQEALKEFIEEYKSLQTA